MVHSLLLSCLVDFISIWTTLRNHWTLPVSEHCLRWLFCVWLLDQNGYLVLVVLVVLQTVRVVADRVWHIRLHQKIEIEIIENNAK